MSIHYKSIPELVALVGERIKEARLAENLSRDMVAIKGGVSLTAIRHLENGEGATIETLIRTLVGIGKEEALESFLPSQGPSPLQILALGTARKRARARGTR